MGAGLPYLPTRGSTSRGRIARVEYSLDEGRTWARARLSEPNVALAWVRWSFQWDARPGDHTFRVRATDDQGTPSRTVSRSTSPAISCTAVVQRVDAAALKVVSANPNGSWTQQVRARSSSEAHFRAPWRAPNAPPGPGGGHDGAQRIRWGNSPAVRPNARTPEAPFAPLDLRAAARSASWSWRRRSRPAVGGAPTGPGSAWGAGRSPRPPRVCHRGRGEAGRG
jgi:hypothetical protein